MIKFNLHLGLLEKKKKPNTKWLLRRVLNEEKLQSLSLKQTATIIKVHFNIRKYMAGCLCNVLIKTNAIH